MPGPLAIASTAASVISGASSIFGALSGNKASRQAAERQADLVFSQRMEELRRMQFEQDQMEGYAVAAGYASNVRMTGSTKQYIDMLREEHDIQQEYTRQAAGLERYAIRKGAPGAGLGTISAIGQAANTISSAVGTYKSLTK